MIRWRKGVVSAVLRADGPMCEVTVDVSGTSVPALADVAVVGSPGVGDVVLLNTNALDLALGTGGHAMVVALPDRLPADAPPAGHIMKVRYTPLQVAVGSADEQGSAHHAVLADADDLGGVPVVVADLHSALPAICLAIAADRPGSRVGYVMTDGGALPMHYSRTVLALRSAGLLAGTVSAGQAYGGDHEAVNVHTALLVARLVLGTDIVVVAQGPGNLGTDTRWGFSGVAAGEAVNAVGLLGGRAVGSLRISGADPRERHLGISHHSLTAYGRVALLPAELAVPVLAESPLSARIRDQLATLPGRHRQVGVELAGLADVLEDAARQGIRLATMGRGLAEDPAYFLAAAAAGRHAARLCDVPA
ncbi:MAG: hypothetical protein QOE76_2099 [Frankiales bacterium]|nr:hypothetical protein [Frankiales bacterium]